MDRDASRRQAFSLLILPHLAAAYNVAVWIAKSRDAASDVVQESCVKALNAFDQFRGDNPRAWFLAIVRNTSLNWLAQMNRHEFVSIHDNGDGADDNRHKAANDIADDADTTEMTLIQNEATETLNGLIEALPLAYREIIVLREIEELSYKEIATVTGLPIGTVMSRLARGREVLRKNWEKLPKDRRQNGM